MSQLGFFEPDPPEPWSVSALNRYVRQLLEADPPLRTIRVSGEISGFKPAASGHWYFTLKDASAQINCVLWRSRAERQTFHPREGDAVTATGKVTLYESRGAYQLDIATLELAGQGNLYQEFERLKARLKAEGLFDRPKRPLPRLPRVIGLVTSPSGAALRDILNILRRRWPLARVVLAPTLVQGAEAPTLIVTALERIQREHPDVIIVARGGGSLEDLWCFNDERVARAIAALPVPSVSGVGHETDFTIADFVADVRAPTPSAAAELVSAVALADLRADIDSLSARLEEQLRLLAQNRQWELETLRTRLNSLSPQATLRLAHQRLQATEQRAIQAIQQRLRLDSERSRGLTQALNAVSPLNVLKRGYAVVTRPTGTIIRRAAEVRTGETLQVQVSEGGLLVEVRQTLTTLADTENHPVPPQGKTP